MSLESTQPSLIGVLCSTLDGIERSGEIDPGDPAFVQLKRSITRAIAEFEVAKTARSSAEPELPQSGAELEPPLLEPS